MDLPLISVEIQHNAAHQDRSFSRRSGARSRGRSGWRRWVALALAGVLGAVAAAAAGQVQLRIGSQPDRASVALDGRQRGKTPLSLAVAPGPHTLLLEHPDALDEQQPLSLTGDLDVDVSLWLRRPPAVQLRSPYPGASIAAAALLADGRLALSIALPEPADRPGSGPAREAWLFDPATGSLVPFVAEANPRAAMLAVSPDGRRVALLRPAPAPGPSMANVGTRPRLDQVWVADADGGAPAEVFALPPPSAAPGALATAVEEVDDLAWTPDGQHVLVTTRLLGATGGSGAAPRSRLLLVDPAAQGQDAATSPAPVELAVLPAELVPGSYSWAPDGHWTAFLAHARVLPGGADSWAVCAVDTAAGGAVAGFRYLADLGRQTDARDPLPVAPVAWAPGSDGRLLYTAAAPKVGAANPLGLPSFVGSSGSDAGLFLATPGGPALGPEDGRRLGSATGLAAPTWLARAGPGGAHVLALARSDRRSKPLVVRSVELPDTVAPGEPVAARWDLEHGRVLVVAHPPESIGWAILDYWLVQLRSGQAGR